MSTGNGSMRLEAIVILLLVFLVACKPAPAWTALDTRTPSPARLPPTRVFSGSDKLGGAVIIYQRRGGPPGLSGPCRDCFTYRITVSHEGQVRTVMAMDAAADTPAEFWQILERIRELVASLEQESWAGGRSHG